MDSPYLLIFLLGLVIGTFIGIILGNKKVRKALAGMIRSGDDEDDYYDEDND